MADPNDPYGLGIYSLGNQGSNNDPYGLGIYSLNQPQQPERSWWDTAKEMGASITPSLVGGAIGSLAGPWGTVAGSAIGSGIGELWRQDIADEPTNLPLAALETGIGAIPFGKQTAGLMGAIKYGAKSGLGQSLISTAPRHLMTTGELPTLGQAGTEALFGTAFGGATSAGMHFLPRPPHIDAGAGAQNVDLTTPPPPIEAAPPPPPMTDMQPYIEVSINNPRKQAELEGLGYIPISSDGQTIKFVRKDTLHQNPPSEPTTPITETPSTQDPNHMTAAQVIQEFGSPIKATTKGPNGEPAPVEIYTLPDETIGYRRIRSSEPPIREEPPIESYDIGRGETPFTPVQQGLPGLEDIGGTRHIGDPRPPTAANETPSEDEIRRYLSRMLGRPATDDEVARAIERQARTGEFTGRVAPFPPPEILAMRQDDLGNTPRPPAPVEKRILEAELDRLGRKHESQGLTPAEKDRFREIQERLFPGSNAEQDFFEDVPNPFAPTGEPILRPGEGEPGLRFDDFTAEAFNPNVDEVGPSGPRGALEGFDVPRMGQQDLPFGPTRSVRPEKILGEKTLQELEDEGSLLPGGKYNPLPPRPPEGPLPQQLGLGIEPIRGQRRIDPETGEPLPRPISGGSGVDGREPEWFNHPDRIGAITDKNQANDVEMYWHERAMERHRAGDRINADLYSNLADLAGERHSYLIENPLPPGHTDIGGVRNVDLNQAIQRDTGIQMEARRREIEERYQRDGFARDKYRLPDGTIVPVDATATKGEQISDFTMRDGKIVKMEYAGPMGPNDKIDMKTGRVIEGPASKAVVRPMTEFGSKQWGIYVDGELVEGGFFSQKAAQNSAWNYGELDISTSYAELPEGFEDEFSESFRRWDQQQNEPYVRGQLDLPLGKYEPGVPRGYEPSMRPRNELGQFITAAEAAKIQQDIPGLVSRTGIKDKPETIITPGIRGGSGEGEAPIHPSRIVEINAPREGDPPIQPPGNVPPDQVPPGSRPPPPNEPPASVKKQKPLPTKSGWEQAYDAVRNLTTGLDISAPMRQGLPLIATKSWWTSWGSMLKAWGSQAAYDANQKSITDHYLFKARELANGKTVAGFGQRMGLRLIDQIDHIEEATASKWVEKNLPGFKASNRAYNAFLNKLRADTFTNLIEEADRLGKNPYNDETLAREIAEFVNTATGAASIKLDVPSWMSKSREVSFEQSAKALGYLLFSPRQTFSRARMLNPLTYSHANPYVRKQYMKAMVASASAWGTIAGAAAISGYADEVSLDPTSADFGKIRVGKTRLDVGGGFQQYLVATARLLSGQRTTAASAGGPGNTQVLGEGYQARTGLDVAQMFLSNKLHPLTKFGYDFLAASEYQPFQTMDKIAQIVVPLYMQDAYEIITQNRPEILPMLFPAAIGMGTQTYEAGQATSRIVPEKYDFKYTGGERPLSDMWRR